MPIRWRLTVFNALSIGVILVVLGLSLFLLLRNALLSGIEEAVRIGPSPPLRPWSRGKASTPTRPSG